MKIFVILSLLFFKELFCENLSDSNHSSTELEQKNRQLILENEQLHKTIADLRIENANLKKELYEIRDNHGAHHREKRNTLSEEKDKNFTTCDELAHKVHFLTENYKTLSDEFKRFQTIFDKEYACDKKFSCSTLSNHVGYLAHYFKTFLEDANHFNIFIYNQLTINNVQSPLCLDGKPVQRACNAKVSNGNWNVIQRRQDGSVNFYRGWADYKAGFGTMTGEFFVGLDCLHLLTTCARQELLIEMEDRENQKRYAKYDLFLIGDESEKYKMKELGKYEGNAGDSLDYHRSQKFTTFDQDNDEWPADNCAKFNKGGWWYKFCLRSSLNGEYGNNEHDHGVNWYHWHGFGYSLTKAEMKIRPKN